MQHQDSCLNKGSGAGQTTAAGRWGPNVSGGQPAQTCPDAGAPGARREASLQGPSLQGTHVSPLSVQPRPLAEFVSRDLLSSPERHRITHWVTSRGPARGQACAEHRRRVSGDAAGSRIDGILPFTEHHCQVLRTWA